MNPFLRMLVLSALLLPAFATAQAHADRIASKSIARVYGVQRIVFALAEDGRSFSWLDLFASPTEVETVEWPWDGAIEGGVPWRQSMLLRANYAISDSQRVVRAATAPVSALFNESPVPLHGDSLIFKDTALVTTNGAGLTAVATRADTALLGFGRLGLAYSIFGPEAAGSRVFADSIVTFWAFPRLSDNAVNLITCKWNTLCRSDSVTVPAGGLDSVISVAIDSSNADSTWLLIATQSGLRRGLWRGTSFPHVTLPGIPDSARVPVPSVYTSPSGNRAWAFTSFKFFYSDDHGATFRVPPSIPGLPPSTQLTNYSTALAPQVAFSGDTSFVNFNMTTTDAVGIVRFRLDTLLANQVGTGLEDVLINANDSLDIGAAGEGSLTGLAVVRNGNLAALVTGTTLKGIFYRRLDLPGKTFTNITSRIPLQNGLAEVITYPTLFEGPGSAGSPQYVRIGYRLKKSGKVTITIYNYAMEKVRTVVRNAPRQGGVPRSELIGEDRWDGRDSGGRLVSVGTYYIRVESDQGEAAFGKVICVRGRR